MGVGVFDALDISIHAPQWGATGKRHLTTLRLIISIHAPQWGATTQSTTQTIVPSYFNPRTPVGCDVGFTAVFLSLS